MGFPLKAGLGSIVLAFRCTRGGLFWVQVIVSCVSERAPDRGGLTRLMTSWTGMQFQGKYFVYISGLGCIWCLALHATGDAGGQCSVELDS